MYRPTYVVLSEYYSTLPAEWIIHRDLPDFFHEELEKDGNVCMLDKMPINLATLPGLHWFIRLHTPLFFNVLPPNELKGCLGHFIPNPIQQGIEIRNNLDPKTEYKVLMHELTHYAQFLHGQTRIEPLFPLTLPTRDFLSVSSEYIKMYQDMIENPLLEFGVKDAIRSFRCEMEAFFLMEIKPYKGLPSAKVFSKTGHEKIIPALPRIKKRIKVAICALVLTILNPMWTALPTEHSTYSEPITLEKLIEQKEAEMLKQILEQENY